jgi:hypothetical protein
MIWFQKAIMIYKFLMKSMKNYRSKLVWIRSTQSQSFSQPNIKQVSNHPEIMSRCLARDKCIRVLSMNWCLKDHLKRASRLISETIQCLSQLTASKLISTTIVSLIIWLRSITKHITNDLLFERKTYINIYLKFNFSLRVYW